MRTVKQIPFYVLMAFLFPLLNHRFLWIRAVSVTLLPLMGVIARNWNSSCFYWLPIFSFGISVYQLYAKRISAGFCCGTLSLSAACCIATIGEAQAIVGMATAITIWGFGNRTPSSAFSMLSWFGTISYSLYLVHYPIGGRVINLATRLPETLYFRYPMVLVALLVSTLAAYLFWRFIEKPSQMWSVKVQK